MSPDSHPSPEQDVYLALGANIGDPVSMLQRALRGLDAIEGVTVLDYSSLYRTSPVGKVHQPDFINMAARISAAMEPDALMAAILDLEHRLGRVRNERWGPRTIDIDLLMFGDRQIHAPELTIPHPRMWERAFVLIPLLEIAPNLRKPADSRPLKKIIEEFGKEGNIQLVGQVNFKE